MENITLGQISTILGFLVTLITSITYLSNVMRKHIDKLFIPIRNDIKEVDKSQCKNYLVRFLKDVEKEVQLSEVERERAYECYEHYTKDLGGNSYVHDWWHRLMEDRK